MTFQSALETGPIGVGRVLYGAQFNHELSLPAQEYQIIGDLEWFM